MRYFKLFHDSFGEFLGVQVKPNLLISLSHIDPDITSVDQLLSASNLSNTTIDEIATNILDKSKNPLEVEISDIGFTIDNDANFQILRPFDPPEVWAAGVTYKSSEMERRRESETPDLYSEVYGAERPELFLKSTAERCMGPLDDIGIRTDSTWDVPEAELGFVIFNGEVCGFTCGNDVSSRSIEGENALYLPQAKVYDQSCSIGPCFVSSQSITDPQNLQVSCRVIRDGNEVFSGQTNTNQMARGINDLANWLQKSNTVPNMTVVITGTGVVPPPEFSLLENDTVQVEIEDIGILENVVVDV